MTVYVVEPAVTGWRALTVKQPWAWALCHAGKDVENRTWPIPPKLFQRRVPELRHHAITLGGEMGWDLFHPAWCDADPCPFSEGAEFLEPYGGDYIWRADEDGVPSGLIPESVWNAGTEPLRVMLHAGKEWDRSAPHRLPDGSFVVNGFDRWVEGHPPGAPGSTTRQPFGAVVAVVTFTGCHVEHADRYTELGCCETNPWAQFTELGEKGVTWHWVIGDVTVLPTPVPARGRQRLWTPDPDIIEAVEAQLL